jgi:hypothetical protein
MSRNREILERSYSTLQHKGGDELRSSIEEGFAPDAVLRISDHCRTAAGRGSGGDPHDAHGVRDNDHADNQVPRDHDTYC